MFSCPHCCHGPDYRPAEAPLASAFAPHSGLRGLLSKEQAAAPCTNCPPDAPNDATVHCKQCKLHLCGACDDAVHSPSMAPSH